MQESMAQEGQELAKASFGPTILLAIGKAYEGQAAIYLGGYIQGGLASLKQEGQSIKSKVLLHPLPVASHPQLRVTKLRHGINPCRWLLVSMLISRRH